MSQFWVLKIPNWRTSKLIPLVLLLVLLSSNGFQKVSKVEQDGFHNCVQIWRSRLDFSAWESPGRGWSGWPFWPPQQPPSWTSPVCCCPTAPARPPSAWAARPAATPGPPPGQTSSASCLTTSSAAPQRSVTLPVCRNILSVEIPFSISKRNHS